MKKRIYQVLFVFIVFLVTSSTNAMLSRTSGLRNVRAPSRSYLQKQSFHTIQTPLKARIANTVSVLTSPLLRFWYGSRYPTATGTKYLKNVLSGTDFLNITLGLDDSYAQTPSYRHLQKFYSNLDVDYPFTAVISDSRFRNMIREVMDKEKETINQYEVFYHGRDWTWGLLSDIYGMLYSHVSGKELHDFIFTQFKKYTILESQNEQLKREEIRNWGSKNYSNLLFLTKYLFGNLGRSRSNAMYYVAVGGAAEQNVSINVSIKEIFDMFGYDSVFKMYENQLSALMEEYKALSEHGQLLQVLVPKEMVDKSVYFTVTGGRKKDTASAMVHFFNEEPQDIGEFALILTGDSDGGLSPDKIKIVAYNTVDPEKMAKFKEKENDLRVRIKQSLEQIDAQRKREQLARE